MGIKAAKVGEKSPKWAQRYLKWVKSRLFRAQGHLRWARSCLSGRKVA